MRKLLFLLLFIAGLFLGVLSQKTPLDAAFPKKEGRTSLESFIDIDVFYHEKGEVITLDLEEYVKGVLAGEMPSSFHEEALKAQAIAARTYAVKKMRIFGGTSYSQSADVSSDYKVDQAWLPDEALKKRWGALNYWLNISKIEKAVKDTEGLILTYNGNPCQTLYHSTCGGKTEAVKDVFREELPYLVSVPCTFCSASPNYRPEALRFSLTEVGKCLGVSLPVSTINSPEAFKVSEISQSGRVKEVKIGQDSLTGQEFRTALGLKSTLFSWETQGDELLITVRGYGHGVGMCQYGADGMGRSGRTYLEILSYYYPGTEVSPIFFE